MKRVIFFVGILGLFVMGCATGKPIPKTFESTLEVDFGPAHKPSIRQSVQVQQGTTPEGLVAKVLPVEKGSICCDPRETAVIDGVAADPAANRWWSVSVNGSRKVSPYRARLKPGDVVRWEYRQHDH